MDPEAPATRALLASGLLVSLITAGGLVQLRFGGLDGMLASLAGALAGLIALPVAGAQLAVRRWRPRPVRVSPLLLHAVLVPWAVALAAAGAIVAGSSLALAEVRSVEVPGADCASFGELLRARWSLAASGGALVAGLHDGSNVRFTLAGGMPVCRSEPSRSRR
jgi:hypothetical protein